MGQEQSTLSEAGRVAGTVAATGTSTGGESSSESSPPTPKKQRLSGGRVKSTGDCRPAEPSNFTKVVEFNEAFGVIPEGRLGRGPDPAIFSSDGGEVESCMKLIREEVKELERGVERRDLVETVDALADILYVVYGMGARLGVDMDKAFALVHDNNMSKLCRTQEEARESAEFHREKKTCQAPAVRPSGKYWVVYNSETRKILKPKAWRDVDLSPVCRRSDPPGST
jgi:NTP pyrophosphatase (non-canonical NTP hydrolase)